MIKIKSALGYLCAFFSIFLAVATLSNDGIVGKLIIERADLRISPNMDGGDIIKTIDHDGYRIFIHEPVFLGLFRPNKKGFIQIDIVKGKQVPGMIEEGIDFDIDFDEDQKTDFTIRYHTETDHAQIHSYHPNVSTRFDGVKRKSMYTVRIAMTHPKDQGRGVEN